MLFNYNVQVVISHLFQWIFKKHLRIVNFIFPRNEIQMSTPAISKKAFWDIDFSKLDFEKSSLYTMEKVFNYGSWSDQVEIMRYYGLPRIRNEIINAGYLRMPVLSFLCTILRLQKTDFTCYKRMLLNPIPWNY